MGNINEQVSETLRGQIAELEQEMAETQGLIDQLKAIVGHGGASTITAADVPRKKGKHAKKIGGRGAFTEYRFLSGLIIEGGVATGKRLAKKHKMNSGSGHHAFVRLRGAGMVRQVVDPKGTTLITYEITDAGRKYQVKLAAELGFGEPDANSTGQAAPQSTRKAETKPRKKAVPLDIVRERVIDVLDREGETRRTVLQQKVGASTAGLDRAVKLLVKEGIVTTRKKEIETEGFGRQYGAFFALAKKGGSIRLHAGHGEVGG